MSRKDKDTQPLLLNDDHGHGHDHGSHGHGHGGHGSHGGHGKERSGGFNSKSFALISIGVLTLFYVLAELTAAIYTGSLTLLSDGFHNLTDVISLFVAWWAQNAAKRGSDDQMSYGWARAEVLGGLTNGCFLISMGIYVALEAIPRFIHPQPMEQGIVFISIAASGLAINTLGTIVFACTGQAHAHSHGGGGGGHSHAHGGTEKKKEKKEKHGHGHGHDGAEKKKDGHKKEKHGHGHGHDAEQEHGHSHRASAKFDDEDFCDHGHSHGAEATKKKKDSHKKKDKHSDGKMCGMDLNMFGVFIHFLGDAIASLFVLVTGIILQYSSGGWTDYVDPVSSLIIIGLTMLSSVPLVKRASLILLQQVPNGVNLDKMRTKIRKVEGVLSLHDLHVWQLVDGMTIGTVHVGVEEGSDFALIVESVKPIFHHYGIHSTSIQPEFIHKNIKDYDFCAQNCIQECEEEWCCKKTAEKVKERGLLFAV
ncbi:hypothetical protein SAMD00019534_056580 [Acytostelium subglobosum LB1]|uniref:hypothetical protein n=1 Tax=Acytostelium subglobosum LB1 TaxID=1410327 RepID=UPI000645204B|nr:hypothetical protein SAMD00019534_056580 [Acytostelium subglobosum LB1]GAM22483.1 hypothetical protein SAMD00019534_056580 [Acytostelium subglobosum LB1]|eukprot:XP_012754603.1 hypothetical protein SAMD00019534_056580 [Acytostelium subglobosum LB1]